MAKYHYNIETGKSGVCTAGEGNCPVQGGDAPHFNSQEGLNKFIEFVEKDRNQDSAFTTLKKSKSSAIEEKIAPAKINNTSTDDEEENNYYHFNNVDDLYKEFPKGSTIEIINKTDAYNRKGGFYTVEDKISDDQLRIKRQDGYSKIININNFNGEDGKGIRSQIKLVMPPREKNLINYYGNQKVSEFEQNYPEGTKITYYEELGVMGDKLYDAKLTDEQKTFVGTVASINDDAMVVVDFNNKSRVINKISLGDRFKIQNVELPESPNYDVISFSNDLPEGAKFSKRIPQEYYRKNVFGRFKKEMGEDITEGTVIKNNGSIIEIEYHRESPRDGMSNRKMTISREDFLKSGYEYTPASQNLSNNMPYPTEGFNEYSQNSPYVG